MNGITRCLSNLDKSVSQRVVVPPAKRNLLFWIEYGERYGLILLAIITPVRNSNTELTPHWCLRLAGFSYIILPIYVAGIYRYGPHLLCQRVNGYLWIIGSTLALVCSVSGRWNRETQHQLVILNIGLLLDVILSCILKLVIQRPRPGYNVKDQKFEAPIADQFSFPSGHSSRAAMLATLCAAFFPKYRFAAMLMAVVVAMSRVAMGRHYLSDALGGLLLGWLEGLAVLALPRGVTVWIRQILN